jgi:hypothetical protein
LVLYQALEGYAATHGDAFPAGKATPEASLSLLYRSDPTNTAELLRGKSVPVAVVQEILDRGELLWPGSCGWHYVEGLRPDDDPRLAVFWDKAGLDHFGRRLAGGGHTVMFVDGQRKYIPEAEWPPFRDGQNKLLEERARSPATRADGTVQIAGQAVHVHIRIVGDTLWGGVWRGGRNAVGLFIAQVEAEPPAALAGRPVMTRTEVRDARVVVDQKKQQVR